jgi:plastocyanin
MKRAALTAAALAAAALLSTSVAGAKPAEPVPDRVGVRGAEYELLLSKRKVQPGQVIVQFVNAGEDSHDLKLQRIDPASGVQVGPVLGAGPVQPGAYENIDTHLKKGTKYVLWCSLADHRLRGMEATIKVARHRTSPSA